MSSLPVTHTKEQTHMSSLINQVSLFPTPTSCRPPQRITPQKPLLCPSLPPCCWVPCRCLGQLLPSSPIPSDSSHIPPAGLLEKSAKFLKIFCMVIALFQQASLKKQTNKTVALPPSMLAKVKLGTLEVHLCQTIRRLPKRLFRLQTGWSCEKWEFHPG